MSREAVLELLKHRREQHLAELVEWTAIPSISAQTQHAGDLRRACDWAADYCRAMGLETEVLLHLAAHQKVELLVGSTQLDVSLQGDGVIALHQRVEELVYRDGLATLVALFEVIALEHPRTGRIALFVNELMTDSIVELEADEGEALLQELLEYLDDPAVGLHDMLGRTVYAITGDVGASGSLDEAEADLAGAMAHVGWQVGKDAPALAGARSVLARMHELGWGPGEETLRAWAEAADRAAEGDLAAIGRTTDREEAAETALVGTVLGDALLAALRRIAQESRSAQRYRAGP